MSEQTFTLRWEAADGYMGGSRPHTLELSASDFDGLTPDEAEQAMYEILQDAFIERVTPEVINYNAFKAWSESIAKDRP